MKTLPASHGAVLTGLQPLCVALYATWLAQERPSRRFWGFALLGSALTIAYALRAGGGALQAGDLAMLVAVIVGALGYAEGGRLARQLGGWQVICWALVLAAPFLVLPVGWLAWQHQGPVAASSWFAFAYVSLFSQFIGFFAWYAGLAKGGIARVGQVQLLQVFFTLGFSALWFGEHVDRIAWLFAAAVVTVVAIGRRAGGGRPVAAGSGR
jgi:drug/metabolite transporter (DMT)-like permease